MGSIEDAPKDERVKVNPIWVSWALALVKLSAINCKDGFQDRVGIEEECKPRGNLAMPTNSENAEDRNPKPNEIGATIA